MPDEKKVTAPIIPLFKLSSTQFPVFDEDIEYMSPVPYSSVACSLMYAMICSCPDLSYAMSLASRYMANPGKEH
jgi:ATP-binding cassette subfamily B (MDR/TAP) protein 1